MGQVALRGQGGEEGGWVTNFTLGGGFDGIKYMYIFNKHRRKEFPGPTSASDITCVTLLPARAQWVVLKALEWQKLIAVRWEIYETTQGTC